MTSTASDIGPKSSRSILGAFYNQTAWYSVPVYQCWRCIENKETLITQNETFALIFKYLNERMLPRSDRKTIASNFARERLFERLTRIIYCFFTDKPSHKTENEDGQTRNSRIIHFACLNVCNGHCSLQADFSAIEEYWTWASRAEQSRASLKLDWKLQASGTRTHSLAQTCATHTRTKQRIEQCECR